MIEIHETETRDGIFAGDDPYALARFWLGEAGDTEPNDPNAMALATVDADGLPNVRIVLLKEIEPDTISGGFLFYTNYESAKGVELLASRKAALVLHWKTLGRQVRLRGPVEIVGGAKADAYFESRHPQSRRGAIASDQSRPLESREALMARVDALRQAHGDEPPRPPNWGGFRLRPVEMEFWANGDHRLHDRFVWRRDAIDATAWKVQRLNP